MRPTEASAAATRRSSSQPGVTDVSARTAPIVAVSAPASPSAASASAGKRGSRSSASAAAPIPARARSSKAARDRWSAGSSAWSRDPVMPPPPCPRQRAAPVAGPRHGPHRAGPRSAAPSRRSRPGAPPARARRASASPCRRGGRRSPAGQSASRRGRRRASRGCRSSSSRARRSCSAATRRVASVSAPHGVRQACGLTPSEASIARPTSTSASTPSSPRSAWRTCRTQWKPTSWPAPVIAAISSGRARA